jgi:oligoribonuclease
MALDRPVTPPLVWIDLEMSGLDPHRHAILEIAIIVTDDDIRLVD